MASRVVGYLHSAPAEAYAGGVITAVHTLVYADDAEAARAFFRDVLGWPHAPAYGV